MNLPKRSLILLFALLLIFSLTVTVHQTDRNPLSWSLADLVPTTAMEPLVTHIVLFKYKSGASPTDIKKINAQMLALKKTCQHPVTQRPYIKYISGGVDNSMEKLQEGMTHGFVLQFATIEDRDYYVEKDPAHAAFKKESDAVVEKAQVVDYTDGVFIPPTPATPVT